MYILYKINALYITYYTNIQWRAISLSLFIFIWDTKLHKLKQMIITVLKNLTFFELVVKI